MTPQSWAALLVFTGLCASAGIGALVRPYLPQHHRERETVEAMHLMITMLVTFAGLVLGLLIASAKSDYTQADQDSQQYAFQLARLDRCLQDYGPESRTAQAIVKTYTGAMIASTWPDEKRPAGINYPDMKEMPVVGESPVLTVMLDQLGTEIRRLTPSGSYQTGLQQNCEADYENTIQTRWAVIEDVGASISAPFYWVLVCWLTIVFTTFGLVAPRNSLSVLGIVLSSVSISLAVFVISDLSQPYGGLFSIPSTYMRAALAQMMR